MTDTRLGSEHSGFWPDNQGTAVVPLDRGLTGNQVLVDSRVWLRGDDHLLGLRAACRGCGQPAPFHDPQVHSWLEGGWRRLQSCWGTRGRGSAQSVWMPPPRGKQTRGAASCFLF